MELGMIGLGKMGAYMTERLLRAGHQVVSYDRDPAAIKRVAEKGAKGADSLEDVVKKLSVPRNIWLMVPSGDPVDQTIQALLPHLKKADTVIDGGNSYYKDTLRRAAQLREQSVNYVDVGTSGGVWGITEGYSMMVGGEKEAVEKLRPILETLAPAPDRGWGHVGPCGAGHFVKMVHNGIEYGMMEALAEGFTIIKRKSEFNLNLQQIAEIWCYGSVVRSWLLELIGRALGENPELKGIAPFVADSGEGRWTVSEAVDLNTPAPVITLSLLERIRSRETESFADKLLAAMRHQFGGHAIKTEE